MESETSRKEIKNSGNILEPLMNLIRTLRGENGCPWDRKQTPSSMMIYVIEEIYELSEAIESGHIDHICEELGDVLFQVLFVFELFREKQQLSLSQVVDKIMEKMIRRHPHVFGNTTVKSAEEVVTNWQLIKKTEKKDGLKTDASQDSILDSIPANLPPLLRAYRISERAAKAGFEWDTLKDVMVTAEEEWFEFKEELDQSDSGQNKSGIAMEFGDLLFTLVNVARFARIHPETCLRRSTRKFEMRFKNMEKEIQKQGESFDKMNIKELHKIWDFVKQNTPD